MHQSIATTLGLCISVASAFSGSFTIGGRIHPRQALAALKNALADDGVILNNGLVQPSAALDVWLLKQPAGTDCIVSQCVTVAGALAQIWATVVDESPCAVAARAVPGGSTVLLFPDCSLLSEARMLPALLTHLETCKDLCDVFGSSIQAFAVDPNAPPSHPVHGPAPGIRLKFFFGSHSQINEWDDEWDNLDPTLKKLLDEATDDSSSSGATDAEIIAATNKVPPDHQDDELVTVSREWVQAVIADTGICPFTTSATMAGLPLGPIRYAVSRADTAESMYAAYWHEVALLESAPPRQLSTTLLLVTQFGFTDPEQFMALSDTLNNPLEPLRLEDTIQLVFFHPQWVFRDGKDRHGSESAGNFARRSPFPMINILRTPQVRIAQRSIPTGLVYEQNEKTLDKVGHEALQRMLVKCDWAELTKHKVDRRSNELFKNARDLVDKFALSTSGPETTVLPVSPGTLPTTEAQPVTSTSTTGCPVQASQKIDEMAIDEMVAAMEILENRRPR